MSNKALFIILFNCVVFLIGCKLLFKTFRKTIKAFIYFLLPGWVFPFTKECENSFIYSHKVSFLIILMIVLIFMELVLFY